MINLTLPVKHMILLAQLRKSTHFSEGIHESELPYIPERECSKSPLEVDVQDTDVKYLRIPKRIGCHTEGIPERELPPPPPSERKVRSSAQKRLDRILLRIGHKYQPRP